MCSGLPKWLLINLLIIRQSGGELLDLATQLVPDDRERWQRLLKYDATILSIPDKYSRRAILCCGIELGLIFPIPSFKLYPKRTLL